MAAIRYPLRDERQQRSNILSRLFAREFDVAAVERRHPATILFGARDRASVLRQHRNQGLARRGIVVVDETGMEKRDFGVRLGRRGGKPVRLHPLLEGLAGEFRQLLVAMDSEHLLHHACAETDCGTTQLDSAGTMPPSTPCTIRIAQHLLAQLDTVFTRLHGPRTQHQGAGNRAGIHDRRAAYRGMRPRTVCIRNKGRPRVAFARRTDCARRPRRSASTASNSAGNDGHKLKHSRHP